MPPKKANKTSTNGSTAKKSSSNTSETGSAAPPKSVVKLVDTREPYGPSQKVDLNTWPGWVELESEPAYFNVLLKDIGVRGVKVQEVVSLDEEMLAFIPKPVHALIFLFKYTDAGRAEPNAAFPDDVWFARQTASNACATHALLNIIYNIPGLHLGARLESFKQATTGMTPLEKGNEVDQLHFVRALHNSFATENDIIAVDQILQDNITAAHKRQAAAKAKKARAAKAATKVKTTVSAAPSRASTRKKAASNSTSLSVDTTGTKRKHDDTDEKPIANTSAKRAKIGEMVEHGDDTKMSARRTSKRRKVTVDEEAAYHFCAYLPINGHLWKLDGLEPTPEDIGKLEDGTSWLDLAIQTLQDRMATYAAGSIEFNLMAVVHDPLLEIKQSLNQNIKSIMVAEEKLASVVEDWYELKTAESEDLLTGHDFDLGISPGDLTHTEPLESFTKQLDSTDDLSELLDIRKAMVDKQPPVRAAVRDELAVVKADDVKAFHRRHDYASFVRSWFNELAETEMLADLL